MTTDVKLVQHTIRVAPPYWKYIAVGPEIYHKLISEMYKLHSDNLKIISLECRMGIYTGVVEGAVDAINALIIGLNTMLKE